jgi:hypothetical protein
MGDLSDMNDVGRVMRSPEGRERLDGLRRLLLGRTVVDVTFVNDVHAISVLLNLDDGNTFSATQPSLDVESLRAEFEEVIQREYLADYPERRSDFDGCLALASKHWLMRTGRNIARRRHKRSVPLPGTRPAKVAVSHPLGDGVRTPPRAASPTMPLVTRFASMRAVLAPEAPEKPRYPPRRNEHFIDFRPM